MKWLLKLYPPAWRRRYELEMTALVEEQHAGARTVIDLVRGAADAWWIGPRGPLGGVEIWLAAAAYGAASIVVWVGRGALGLANGDWDTVFQVVYWVAFIVFIHWLARQPAAQCDLRGIRGRPRG